MASSRQLQKQKAREVELDCMFVLFKRVDLLTIQQKDIKVASKNTINLQKGSKSSGPVQRFKVDLGKCDD